MLMLSQLNFQNCFDIIKQNLETNEPYRANNSELSDVENLKKVLHDYHAAYFSCAFLQLSLNTMQQSANPLQSGVTLLKQFFTTNLPCK